MNEQTKSTPGPWKVITENEDEAVIVIDYPSSDTGYLYIAMVYGVGYPDNSEGEANARLMKAAPDLLAAAQWALERLICLYGDEGELSEDLMNAIERATGERPRYDDCNEYYAPDERDVFTGEEGNPQ